MDMPAPRILVAAVNFGQHQAVWEAGAAAALDLRRPSRPGPLDAGRLAAELTGFDGVIVGIDPVTRAVLDASPGLRIVAKHGIGMDNIDIPAAAEAGVAVINTPGANSASVAEFAMTLLLAGAKRLAEGQDSLAAGHWTPVYGTELDSKVLGIIGLGRIGRRVAASAAAFGMRVLAHDPLLTDAEIEAAGATGTDLATLLSASDYVTLHLPAAPGGAPLLDRTALHSLKPGAGLINTARGSLVDSVALADLLREGHLSFAAVDVFDREPLPPQHPLRDAPNCILTAHMAACTAEANDKMGFGLVSDLARYFRGEDPRHRVT